MNAPRCNDPMIAGVDPMPAAVATQRHPAPLHLAPVGAKAVALDFDGGRLSADAGVVLLTDLDDQLGFTRALAAVLSDRREARRLHFTPEDWLTQRVLQMAAGDEDANDSNTRRAAPLFKRLRDRRPETDAPLASPPTLSRCENRLSRTALSRMAVVWLEHCLASDDQPPQGIVRDADDTEDPVHGQQEPARSDGYSGGYCCLPLHLYAGLSGRLLTTILNAKRFTGAPRLAVLPRLVQRLRHAWPETLSILRGDSHFASPEVRQWIAAPPHLRSGTGLTSNAVLQELAQEVVEQATRASAHWGRQGTRFHSTRYQAHTWSHSRRVVSKVEVSAHGVNTRCVVTDMEPARTQGLSQHLSCARGPAANDSKDHKRSLQSERTACHRFAAHQCRLLLHAAAYVWVPV